MSHETILRRQDAMVIVVDAQEKLLPAIHDHENLTRNIRLLLEGMRILGVPVLVSEQYPRGLGPTSAEIQPLLSHATKIEKISFSCVGSESFLDALETIDRDQIVIVGVEAHVCVLQTALDLLEQGLQVHIAADAVGSRNPAHVPIALERLRASGGVITCVESVLFELLQTAGSETFKAVSRLLR